MIFHTYRLKNCDKPDVIIQDRIISHVTSTQFLDVIIDAKLKSNLHIMKTRLPSPMAFYIKLEISWIEKH